jgi:hypothetical protein
MDPFTSIFRRARRPRPARSFGASLAGLERRALLASTVSVVFTPKAAAVDALAPADPGKPPGQPLPPGPSTPADPGPSGPPPRDRQRNHVALAEADVRVDGILTPEFALADAGVSKVFVKLGFGGQVSTLGASDGIDRPQSVDLGDVNGDGIPDLVVANSGGGNVLVFPGLPGGLFGPEVNGGGGFAVGQDPVSVTLGHINGDKSTDLIVADKVSDTVTILKGVGGGAAWTATPGGTIDVGGPSLDTAPVKTALVDVNHDGLTDLFVCNSGSNDVYLYRGQPDGSFDASDPVVFKVGINPSEMFVGRFDRRPQLDLVTINSGSDNLTFIGGVLTARPTSQTFSSGGILPDAAFAVDLYHNGVMDLVVANSGDGRLALLQGTNAGMQIAGLIIRSDLPVPTGLAPASWSVGGLDFLAASAGEDAAQLLHFDLGIASAFLASPMLASEAIGQDDDELIAGLMPLGESALDLIAVFWAGSSDWAAVSDQRGPREPSTITALYSPTEGQGEDGATTPTVASKDPLPSSSAPTDPSKVDSSEWARFVLGIDDALGEPRGVVEAIAARDAREMGDGRSTDDLARLDRPGPTIDPDLEAASGAVDEALRLFWSEGRNGDGPRPAESVPRLDPAREPQGIDAPTLDIRAETVPLISSAVLVSARLILKVSASRPPSFRKGPGRPAFMRPGRPDRV